MLDAHVNAAVLVGSPFFAESQPYDFGTQDISKKISADVATMIKHRLTPPREEIYTLHRRLNGCFQLAARVGARIPAREILLGMHARHEWSDEDVNAQRTPPAQSSSSSSSSSKAGSRGDDDADDLRQAAA